MKYYKYLILCIALLLFSCERDDICAENIPTTPRLLIEFFDAADPETLKNVTRLSVYAEALITDENGNITLPEQANNATLLFNSNSNNIALPLIVGNEGVETTTRYFFELDTNLRTEDDDPLTNSNIDILDITYTPNFIYVSRACGFKSIFEELRVTQNPDEDDADEWIISTTLANTTDFQITVENEDDTHVQIFH